MKSWNIRRLASCARRSTLALAAAGSFLAPACCQAIIFYGTNDPGYNTTAPTGDLANSGWELQGRWGAFLGTPIAPNLFITAKHVGGNIGASFNFRGIDYPVIAAFADPQSDLRIFQVCGIFPAHAELYSTGDEAGRSMVVHGRGTRRGTEVHGDAALAGTELKGWRWGASDGVQRWGENIAAEIHVDVMGEFLKASFDASGGPNECHLSTGDSGGGVFIKNNATWKLAGINYAVDGPFNSATTGPGFQAALFDTGGVYFTNTITGAWQYTPPGPVDAPSAFYATRISARLAWINSVLSQHTVTNIVPVLEYTFVLGEEFEIHPEYVVNTTERTITLPEPTGMIFLRLENCLAHQITTTERRSGAWIIHYQP